MVRAQPGADEGLDQPAFYPYEAFSFPGASVGWVGLFLSEGELEASWPSCWVIEFIIACGSRCGWLILHESTSPVLMGRRGAGNAAGRCSGCWVLCLQRGGLGFPPVYCLRLVQADGSGSLLSSPFSRAHGCTYWFESQFLKENSFYSWACRSNLDSRDVPWKYHHYSFLQM